MKKFSLCLILNSKILNWYGQNTYKFTLDGRNTYHLLKDSEMNLIEKQEGQVNVYVLKKRDE